MGRRLTKQERGRAMRLAGAGFSPAEVMDAVGCSFGQARTIVAERNARLHNNSPLWFDRGNLHPPPEAVRAYERNHPRGNYA